MAKRPQKKSVARKEKPVASKRYADHSKHPRHQVAEPSGVREYNESRILELVNEIEYLKEINSLLKSQVDKLERKGGK